MKRKGSDIAAAGVVLALLFTVGFTAAWRIHTRTITETRAVTGPGRVLEDRDGDKGDAARVEPQAADQEPIRHLKSVGGQAGGSCGKELWAKKTLTDPQASQVDLTAAPATIAQLDALQLANEPGAGQAGRAPDELKTWRISGTLTGYKLEGDSDYHLVISDGAGGTLIAEIPSPACDSGSRVAAQIAAARQTFEASYPQASECFNCLSVPVTIEGVGFFDRLHGQTGVAANGVELHPVISFQTGGSPPPPTTGASTTTAPPTTATTVTGTMSGTATLEFDSGPGCQRWPGRHWYHHIHHRGCRKGWYTTP